MDVLRDIAYYSLGGFPVIGYLGIIGYILLVATALVMILRRRKIIKIPVTYHMRLAMFTVIIATIHGILALSVYV